MSTAQREKVKSDHYWAAQKYLPWKTNLAQPLPARTGAVWGAWVGVWQETQKKAANFLFPLPTPTTCNYKKEWRAVQTAQVVKYFLRKVQKTPSERTQWSTTKFRPRSGLWTQISQLFSRPGYAIPPSSWNHFHLTFSGLEKNQGHTLPRASG